MAREFGRDSRARSRGAAASGNAARGRTARRDFVAIAASESAYPLAGRSARGRLSPVIWNDHGIRGAFNIALDAQTQGASWNLQGRVELRRVHRWDLSMRADNPAVNVLIRAGWLPEASTLNFSDFAIEAPRSNARGSGVVTWAETAGAQGRELRVISDGVDSSDVLSWVRAFHPSISEAITAHGSLRFDIGLAGWPLRPAGGMAWTDGATLEGVACALPSRSLAVR